VYLINNLPSLTGDSIMIEKLKLATNIEIINGARVLSIGGERFVNNLSIVVGGKSRDLKLEGVFIEIGLIPNSDFIDIVKKNELGEIMVNTAAETSVPGIFAAGDVTNVPEKQIIIAAGEGAKAGLSAFKYLVSQ
jgi:alkyl hydroperoxide reductase subunit F